jgi:hypothetical protein
LFLATALAAVLAHEFVPRRQPPQSVEEALSRLREAGLCYHVMPTGQYNPSLDNGVFLCERPQSWQHLSRLARCGVEGSRWAGVVHLQRCPNEETANFCLADWGPHGGRVGRVFFFGNPDMVQRVKAVLEP